MEAFIAGYSPNEIPIIAENDTEISIHSKEMAAGHSGTTLAILTASIAMPSPARMPNSTPIVPPIVHIITASLKNCK